MVLGVVLLLLSVSGYIDLLVKCFVTIAVALLTEDLYVSVVSLL